MKMEQIWMEMANQLPKPLVYWATIRLLGHATTGKWARQEVPALTIMTALDRWERDN